MRASGSDENILLKPPRELTLEAALEYIEDDEYVEVTPKVVRLRKIGLTEADRKRKNRTQRPGSAAAERCTDDARRPARRQQYRDLVFR